MEKDKAWEYVEGTKKMTKSLANRLKKLRVEEERGWRGIAHTITNGKTSNQLLGMWLCDKARKFLKETKKKW